MRSWKMERLEELEVYITEEQHIAIRQEDSFGTQDTVIVVPKARVEQLIAFLKEACDELKEVSMAAAAAAAWDDPERTSLSR